ncbi:MAG TPA: VCBS repeat-containing protein [Verrucomicrobiae bacterium]
MGGSSVLAADFSDGVKYWPLNVPTGGKSGFLLTRPEQTGITFTNELTPQAEASNINLLDGSGVALGDYDNDGLCDIFLCNLSGSSRLYRNLGNWKFQDVTEEAGLANSNLFAHGAVFADLEGDGFLDLLVAYSGKCVKLYLNDGHGHFQKQSWNGGAFKDETGKPLAASYWDLGLSASIHDINGDGNPDIYVCDDLQDPDRFWVGDGKGGFTLVPGQVSGIKVYGEQRGCALADYDGG